MNLPAANRRSDLGQDGSGCSGIRLAQVWLISGLFGFFLGAGVFPTTQCSVEYGQALSGAVRYPVGIPEGIFRANLWSLSDQLSALGILAGFSEDFLSVGISGLLGMLSFQALGMLMYSINGRVMISALLPGLFLFAGATAFGSVYPVIMMGYFNTNGIFGLAYAVFLLAIFGAGRYRIGAVLLGLAPACHTVLGGTMWFVILVAWILSGKKWTGESKTLLKWFLVGFSLALMSLFFHARHGQPTPDVPARELKSLLIQYVQTWDYHRRPVVFSSREIFLNLLGLAVCGAALRRSGGPLPERVRLMLKAFIATGCLALAFGILSHVPLAWLPTVVIRAMPARLLNVYVFAYPALVLALLTKAGVKTEYFLSAVLLVLLLSLSTVCGPGSGKTFVFWMLVAGGMLVALDRFRCGEGQPEIQSKRINRYGQVLMLVALAMFLPFHIKNVDVQWLRRLPIRGARPGAASADVLLLSSAIADSEGAQYYLRRPLLLDVAKLDNLPYVPKLLPQVAAIAADVYGVDFWNPPAAARHSARLPPGIERRLWESRSAGEWQALKMQYRFINVLVPAEWTLRLPVVRQAHTPKGPATLYRIPDGNDADNEGKINAE